MHINNRLSQKLGYVILPFLLDGRRSSSLQVALSFLSVVTIGVSCEGSFWSDCESGSFVVVCETTKDHFDFIFATSRWRGLDLGSFLSLPKSRWRVRDDFRPMRFNMVPNIKAKKVLVKEMTLKGMLISGTGGTSKGDEEYNVTKSMQSSLGK
mmetsp:Transcript_4102/g.7334  ORF Transcript_4102/g.7334 Transcript_4102/m.7334 type:complete len:153 (+) Transcript_4102:48-506(+)